MSSDNSHDIASNIAPCIVPYIGRYAPSPTGRLHFGNLRTAMLAWLHARLHQGEFLLRMDDLDTPRVVAGAETQIIEDLHWLGIDWDGDVYRQSEHLQDYQVALTTLSDKRLTYPCYCSRKDIQQAVSAPHGATPVYPGICKNLSTEQQNERAQSKQPSIRLHIDDREIEIVDGFAGKHVQAMRQDCGDFVIKRADNLFAYQFAVVVDDIAQNVTDVVRGEDLLDSSARQTFVFQQFDAPAAHYWHVPLLMDAEGQRMAKRDGSDSVQQWQKNDRTAEQLLAHFATSLGLIPCQVSTISLSELLASQTSGSLTTALKVAVDSN